MSTTASFSQPGADNVLRTRCCCMAALIFALIACLGWALSIGLPEVGLSCAGNYLFGGPVSAEVSRIFHDVRLPRVLMAVLAGAGLSLSGAGTQAVLCNPLVSPSILGLASGASFGAGLMILYGNRWFPFFGQPVLIGAAFLMAMVAVTLSYTLASLRRSSRETVILAGIAVGFIFSGGTVFLHYMATFQDLRAIIFWSVGSLWSADMASVLILVPIVAAGFLILTGCSARLNTLVLGEESAAGLGVNVKLLRLFTLTLCAFICASVVAFNGAIGFVGLIAPHIARTMFGLDNRWLLPGSALAGALLLLFADSLARTFMWPQELPVGVTTSLVGGPFFLFLLLRRKKDWWS